MLRVQRTTLLELIHWSTANRRAYHVMKLDNRVCIQFGKASSSFQTQPKKDSAVQPHRAADDQLLVPHRSKAQAYRRHSRRATVNHGQQRNHCRGRNEGASSSGLGAWRQPLRGGFFATTEGKEAYLGATSASPPGEHQPSSMSTGEISPLRLGTRGVIKNAHLRLGKRLNLADYKLPAVLPALGELMNLL